MPDAVTAHNAHPARRPAAAWFTVFLAAAAALFSLPAQAAPPAECGDSFIGGPSTMPVLIKTWPVVVGTAAACMVDVDWLTFFSGVPVIAKSSTTTADRDIAGRIVTLALRPVGAGWPVDMQAGPSDPITEATVRFTGQPAIVVGLGAFDLRPASTRLVGLPGWARGTMIQEGTEAGEEAAEPWIFKPLSPAEGAEYGYEIGIVRRTQSLVDFYRPTLTGDPQLVSSMPLTDLTTAP